MPDDFSSLGLASASVRVLSELSLLHPTPIQKESIPLLLSGRDLIGQSKTGSGKTLAFSLPLLQLISLKQRKIQALVLCPTRELCGQVTREIRRFARHYPGLSVLAVSGGEPFKPQARALGRGVHVVVATPGRLLDHLKRETIQLDSTKMVVLDEADRMLDMGFLPDIDQILPHTAQPHQTVLFSATFPDSIQSMSQTHQSEPAHIVVKDDPQAAGDLRQAVLVTPSRDKFALLCTILDRDNPGSAIIFCNYKATVAKVADALREAGAHVDCIHGDLLQVEREDVLAQFRNQSIRFLVATDVAARGIDIEAIDLVVNFELPHEKDTYIHRMGRTGRAQQKGYVLSLVDENDEKRLATLEELADGRLERLELPKDVTSEGLTRLQAPPPMQTLVVAGGRKDKIRPGDLLGALTGEAGGMNSSDIGKIEIHDRYAYIAIKNDRVTQALKGLSEGKIKGKRFRIATLN